MIWKCPLLSQVTGSKSYPLVRGFIQTRPVPSLKLYGSLKVWPQHCVKPLGQCKKHSFLSWQKCRDVVELPVNVLCIWMSGSASIDGYKHFQTQVHHLLLSLFAPWIWSVARFIFLHKPWKLMSTVNYRMAVPFFSRWPGRVCWCSWHCWTKRRERRPRVSR